MNKSSAKSRTSELDVALDGVKPVTLSFNGEDVSGNGGVLLVAQVEKLTQLLKGASARLNDHRTSSLVKHNMFEQIAQRVFQIISGYTATSDSNSLRFDPALKMAVGRNPVSGAPLASQPTQSRFENSRTWSELYRLCEWLVDYYIQCHPRRPKAITLDFDGSAIETHGLQLHAFWRGGPYAKFMYFPLFVFDEHGWLLVAALRPGDHGEVTWSLPVLKRLVRRLRNAWPGLPITVRADGAFTDAEFYKWMDENEVNYVLGMKHNNVLLTYSKSARQKAGKKFYRKFGEPLFCGKEGAKLKLETIKYIRDIRDPKERAEANEALTRRNVRVFDEFQYAASTWSRKRRVICRVDFADDGLNVRYVVTNIERFSAAQIYKDIYCKRSRAEMWIKHIKETECQRLSCAQFKSNMFRLLLHAFAYLLMHQVSKSIFGDDVVSMNQLRDKYVRVPFHVVETRSAVHVRFSASYLHAHLFRLGAKRLHMRTLMAA